MKKILLSILLLVSFRTFAQTVRYTYHPLKAEGCEMTYSVTKQDTSYYIIAIVRSDRLKFLNEPTMMLRTFDNEVLKLEGRLMDTTSQSSGGVFVGNVIVSGTMINSTAQFNITPAQFEQLKNGVSKVRLSTIPIEHERTFNKDKIGKKLYRFYLDAKAKENDF